MKKLFDMIFMIANSLANAEGLSNFYIALMPKLCKF